MDKINRQERTASIRRIRDLLHDALEPIAKRSDEEWEAIERAVFARLDSDVSGRTGAEVLDRRHMFRSFARPLIAAAAMLTVAIGAFFMFQSGVFSPAPPLQSSLVLDIQGNAAIIDKQGAATASTIQKPQLFIQAGQRFETGDDGSMMVQLAEATGFRLSRNSRIEIVKASQRGIRLFLHYGHALFSVRKRTDMGGFAVITPNAECRIVGTIFDVTVKPGKRRGDARTDLAVFQGIVEIADREMRRVNTSVESGYMVSLHNHAFGDIFSAQAGAKPIRDISLLKAALDLSQESFTAASGIVEFLSQPPQARVVINDQVMGTTPMVLKYPYGTYTVTISSEDYEPWTGSFNVEEMKVNSVSAALMPLAPERKTAQPGAVSLESDLEKQLEDEPNTYVNQPEYVEALIQMTVGEYRKALALLESLNEKPGLSIRDKVLIKHKISQCYQSLGDFRRALRMLKREYRRSDDPKVRSNLLWEIATIKSNCLGDYAGARQTLRQYLKRYPDGPWADEARARIMLLDLLLSELAR
jgi:hypothetical protein